MFSKEISTFFQIEFDELDMTFSNFKIALKIASMGRK